MAEEFRLGVGGPLHRLERAAHVEDFRVLAVAAIALTWVSLVLLGLGQWLIGHGSEPMLWDISVHARLARRSPRSDRPAMISFPGSQLLRSPTSCVSRCRWRSSSWRNSVWGGRRITESCWGRSRASLPRREHRRRDARGPGAGPVGPCRCTAKASHELVERLFVAMAASSASSATASRGKSSRNRRPPANSCTT
jgi:hypothetical protein